MSRRDITRIPVARALAASYPVRCGVLCPRESLQTEVHVGLLINVDQTNTGTLLRFNINYYVRGERRLNLERSMFKAEFRSVSLSIILFLITCLERGSLLSLGRVRVTEFDKLDNY